MTRSAEKKDTRNINIITERFCSKIGDNAVIVTTQTSEGKIQKCLYSDRCKEECEHNKKQ